MNKSVEKAWKRVKRRRGSLYSSTLFMLSILSLITVLLMFLFVSRIVVRNQRERMTEIHNEQLTRLAVDVDLVFQGMEQSVNQLLRTKNSISLMVNPMVMSSEVGYQVVSSMENVVEQSYMVNKAFLYLPITEEVYSSVGHYGSLSDSEDAAIIQNYLETRTAERSAGEECSIRLINDSGSLYLVGDFCVPNFIGALFLQVDMNAFTTFLKGTSDEGSEEFFLLDEERTVIVASEKRRDDITQWLQGKTRGDLINQKNDGEAEYLFYPSSKYGIIYGAHVNPLDMRVSPVNVFMALLPFLIFYAVFSQMYSRHISRKVYAPINRLMQITSQQHRDLDSVNADQSKTELELLESSFQSALGENLQQKELLAHISADVTEQLFRGILMMTNVDLDHIRRTMEGIGLAEYLSGKYQALACRIKPEDERPLSSVEEGLYRRSLLTILEERRHEEYLRVSFFVDAESLAILFCVPEDISVIQMKTKVQQAIDEVAEDIRGLPYTVLFGKGKVYNEITSLRFSYREAEDDVNYLDYQASDDSAEANRSGDYDRRYFAERAEHLAESAEKDKLEDVLKTADSLAEEVCGLGEESRGRILEQILDILVERMIQSHVTAEEIQAMGLAKTMEKMEAQSDYGWIVQKVQEMFAVTVKAIHTNSRKNRYRYVDTAMEYISEHYADGNLSLNEVSEAVGISAPYLSGIFAEVNKGGFSSYISSYRVEQAKRFLTETTESVSEIGYKCGFNSAQSFSRVFKKHTGVSPGQYRERYRLRNESATGGQG